MGGEHPAMAMGWGGDHGTAAVAVWGLGKDGWMLTPKHTRLYPKRGTSCRPNPGITGSELGHPYRFSQGFFSLKGNGNPLFFDAQ